MVFCHFQLIYCKNNSAPLVTYWRNKTKGAESLLKHKSSWRVASTSFCALDTNNLFKTNYFVKNETIIFAVGIPNTGL